MEAALLVIGGKWKGTILYRLFVDEVLRFNEIRRMLPAVSQRMLTTQLRALESDGIIARTAYPEVPPRVEYRLTDYGRTLHGAVMALKAWGDVHKRRDAVVEAVELPCERHGGRAESKTASAEAGCRGL